MLHIALAKGRIAKTVMKRLAEGGFHFSDYSDESRKLIFTDDEERIRVTLVKSPDVAVYVRRGAADAGIVGKDVLMEDGEEDVYEVLDLGIGRWPHGGVWHQGKSEGHAEADPDGGFEVPIHRAKIFRRSLPPIDIIKLNGSVELAPLVGLSDVIVDIVETGTTLRENGLEAYDYFMDFSARLICNKVSYKMKQKEIAEFMALVK